MWVDRGWGSAGVFTEAVVLFAEMTEFFLNFSSFGFGALPLLVKSTRVFGFPSSGIGALLVGSIGVFGLKV